MDNLDVLQVPTSSLLSSSGNSTSSGQSVLPKTLNKIVKKKLYNRTTKRTSPNTPSLRRSSSSKSSSSHRNRRHRWGPLYYRGGNKSSLRDLSSRRKPCEPSSTTDTTPSSTRSVLSSVVNTANRSTNSISSTRMQASTPNRELPYTTQSEQDMIINDSDDDDDDNESLVTPSPIRNSPSYGRMSRWRDASLSATTVASASLYPELPTETSTNFKPYRSKTKDSTIDSDLIDKLREGPSGEVRNSELGRVYTAAMEGENGHVKIGWTKQGVQRRMNGLNSPRSNGKVYYVEDTTPGAQSRFLNAFLAEQIIHLELYNLRRIEIGRNQKEWFEMDMKEAHQVCHKWRNWFMKWKPYDENQQLKEFWRKRLDRIESEDAYDADEHGCLHERWTAFLNPSWWDRASYHIVVTWRTIHQWWAWICENYPIMITLLGIAFWVLYGVVSFLLYIFTVLVIWSGLSRGKNEEGKRRRVSR